MIALNHRLESGEDLAVRQVSGRAQKDERIRFEIRHVSDRVQTLPIVALPLAYLLLFLNVSAELVTHG